jgi:ketosteroid isomerase-like protein
MSQENVELVLRATSAYNERRVDEVLEDWAVDAVLDWSRSNGPDAGIYRGHKEIRAFIQRFRDVWDEAKIDIVNGPTELREGLLIAENIAYLRGRDGIEVRARSAWLITIRDGKQTSLTLFPTKAEAERAVRHPAL